MKNRQVWLHCVRDARPRSCKTFRYAASALAIAASATSALAQEAPPSVPKGASAPGATITAGGTNGPATGLQEVVVTARRREENLNTIPLSVTAISGASMDAQQIKDLRQLARVIPSLDYSDQAGGGAGRNDRSITNLTFRGLVLPTISEISSGGLEFIDGAPVIGASPPAESDIKQVEALKGPQSVYFGRSTFSGAINFITRDPSFTFGGRVVGQVGDYGSNQFQGTLEGPVISDVLAVRVNYRHDFEGGQYKNAADPSERFGDRTTDSLSLAFLYKPISNLRVKGYITYSRGDDGPPAQAAIKPANPSESNCNLGGTEGAYYCGMLPKNIPASLVSDHYTLTPYQNSQLVDNATGKYTFFNPSFLDHGGLKRDTLQSDLRIDYTFGGGYVLTSISAYHTDKVEVLTDLDFRDAENLGGTVEGGAPTTAPYNYPWFYALFQSRSWDLSQELRITSPQNQRIRWTFGANYFTADYYFGNAYATTPFSYGAIFIGDATLTQPKTPAVFGAAYIDILPKLTLSLEGRYQWDIINGYGLADSSGTATNPPTKLSATFTSFSPRVSLDYKFLPNSVLYALFARGYRPGGFNVDLIGQSPTVVQQLEAAGVKLAYQQDRLDNYEVGVKSEFLDHRASLRVAAYYDPYTNGQVINYYTIETSKDPVTFNEVGETANVGTVNLKGVEVEGDAVPVRGLSLNGTFAWNDSTIKQFYCNECVSIYGNSNADGHRLAGAPEFTWTLSGTYERPIVDTLDGFVRVDYRHTGSIFVDNSNTVESRPLDTVDLHLGIRRGPLELEAFATNLFNAQSLTGVYSNTDAIVLQQTFQSKNQIDLALPDLRRLGLRATYAF